MSEAIKTEQFRLCRTVKSRFEEVDGVCQELREALRKHGLEGLGFCLELATRECLNNAVLHGNGGDASRDVQVDLRCARKWISLRVADEGKGFNWRKAKRESLPASEATSGRGLWIATTYADRVCFNASGNQITLWLRKAKHLQGKHYG
jgi:serine/threonine-protein kinase RsbW